MGPDNRKEVEMYDALGILVYQLFVHLVIHIIIDNIRSLVIHIIIDNISSSTNSDNYRQHYNIMSRNITVSDSSTLLLKKKTHTPCEVRAKAVLVAKIINMDLQ